MPLILNIVVPAPHMGGAPVLVYYDNGDWEVTFAREVCHLMDASGAFIGSSCVVDLLSSLSLVYDGDEMDINGDEAYLFVDVIHDDEEPEAPVILLFRDDEADVFERSVAEKMIEEGTEEAFNFIPFSEFIEELARFCKTNAKSMFEEDESDSPLFGFGEND